MGSFCGTSNTNTTAPAATSANQTLSYVSPWSQPLATNLVNQAVANLYPNQTTNADGTINLGQAQGYTAFGQNGAGIGPNQMAAAQSAVAGFSPLQQQAQQGVANLQMPGQFGSASTMAQNAGQGLLNTVNPAMAYGNLGSTMGTQAAGLAGNAMNYGQAGANIGTQGGLGYGAQGSQAGQMGAGYGAMGAQQGASYGQNATNPSAVQAYMNPYLQATLNPALQLQQQQFNQIQAQNQGQATAAGAFGGGRQAVTQGLNQQNQMLAQNQLVGNAYNQAYNTANQNMQQAAALGMQGAGLGIQGQQAAISGANTGLQGVGQALAGQQLGLSGVNAANQAYQTGIQGANTGLAGVNAAQAGYTGANTATANLGNLGTQQQAAQLGILNAQNQMGNQQQANQQAVINQAIQNYANTQNYPMQQFYNILGLTTGVPTSQTQTNYTAPPSALNTAVNAGAAGVGAALVKAKGGQIKEKKMAAGGITSYSIGGVAASLDNMTVDELRNQIKTSSSPFIREKATELYSEKMADAMAARQHGGMGAGIGAASGGMVNMAGGGIVAFAQGGSPYEDGKVGEGSGEAFTPEEMYAGEHRATPLPPAQSVGELPKGAKKFSSYMDMLQNQYGYGKPSEYELEQRAQITKERADAEKSHENNLALALIKGAGKGLQSTSPFAGPGIGNLMETGVESYAKGNADYDTQLKALRAGELDLTKLNATDRNNLLHYAMSGSSAEQVAEDAAASRTEAAKLRMAQVGGVNADRMQLKTLSIAKDLYAADLKAAQDKLGIDKVTPNSQTLFIKKRFKELLLW